jgi:hypothetical protein
MGVLRVEPARAQQWAARSIGAIWRAYDLQLTIYALILTGIGLAMAYSNSVESGLPVLSTTRGSRPSPGRSTSSISGCWP